MLVVVVVAVWGLRMHTSYALRLFQHKALWVQFQNSARKNALEKVRRAPKSVSLCVSLCVCECVCVLMNDFLEQKKKEPLSTFNTLALTQTSY